MKVKKIISITFYILAAMLLLIYVWSELMPHLMLSEMGRLVLLGGSCLFLIFPNFMKSIFFAYL